MATFYDDISEKYAEFIREQPMFFVASAPREGGHVNVSPKGGDTFRILSPNSVCYLDFTGSGNETAAHVHQNGRLTIMFCSFTKLAQIVRLFGSAEVISKQHADWPALSKLFEENPGTRQIIRLNVDMVQKACGYQVPIMDFVQERETLTKLAVTKGAQSLKEYRDEKNQFSLDGLPTHLQED